MAATSTSGQYFSSARLRGVFSLVGKEINTEFKSGKGTVEAKDQISRVFSPPCVLGKVVFWKNRVIEVSQQRA